MSFLPALTPIQWALLGAIPVGIVLLYFLKLRREPVEVPSTYLWSRTIEDLHVNSLMQRLRRNLLLLLQLAAVLLAALALLRPGHHGEQASQDRSVFLLDSSASMLATDVEDDENRFESAKRLIGERIDAMNDTDKAMLVTFSDRPDVLQSFTSDRGRLRDALDRATVTHRQTDILGALKAADGLANPRRSSELGDMNDVQVADAKPADMYLFSDGGFEAVKDFDLGNLIPEYVDIGTSDARNIGVAAFSAERNVERPSEVQVFATIVNFTRPTANLNTASSDTIISKNEQISGDIAKAIVSHRQLKGDYDSVDGIKDVIINYHLKSADPKDDEAVAIAKAKGRSLFNRIRGSFSMVDDVPIKTSASLLVDDIFEDAEAIELEPGEEVGVSFTLNREETVSLKVVLEEKDDFMLDNVAFAGLTPMRTVSVLVLTNGNTPLELGLATEKSEKICISQIESPDYLKTDEYKKRAAAGVDDLIIYDRCTPETMPPTNTFFIGALPSSAGWSWKSELGQINIIDVERTHPIMRYLELFSLIIFGGRAIDGPPGSAVLADSDQGPVLTLAPRDGYQDLVLGFDIISQNDEGDFETNTNWYAERSWPVFVLNLLRYLAGAAESTGAPSYRPGETVRVRVESALAEVSVGRVGVDAEKMRTGASGLVEVTETEEPGNYQVRTEDKIADLFSINLFDRSESTLALVPEITIGYEAIATAEGGVEARKEYWRLLLLAVLALLATEWWLYSRRVA